jgi:hypothetical protein
MEESKSKWVSHLFLYPHGVDWTNENVEKSDKIKNIRFLKLKSSNLKYIDIKLINEDDKKFFDLKVIYQSKDQKWNVLKMIESNETKIITEEVTEFFKFLSIISFLSEEDSKMLAKHGISFFII